jgi:putative tryptophan/tyrosine transport system substrate-binding protein
VHGCSQTRRGVRRGAHCGVLICALAVFQLPWRSLLAAEAPRQVVVLFASGVEAYAEAVDGLRSGLGALLQGAVFIDVKGPQAESEIANAVRPGSQRLAITVGSEAFTALASHSTDAVTIPTMTLRSDGARVATTLQRAGAVHLDVPVTNLLTELKVMFPRRNRIAMIRNPLREGTEPALAGWAKQQGFALQTVDCSRAEDLVRIFLSLKGKADFVIVLPDSSLYNNTTVTPLIVASLENQLPIVAFSSSFVRAGAAVGIYPDFRDIGAQAASLALRYAAISGTASWPTQSAMPDESPRKLQVAVNQRVMRLLGLDYKQPRNGGLVVFK